MFFNVKFRKVRHCIWFFDKIEIKELEKKKMFQTNSQKDNTNGTIFYCADVSGSCNERLAIWFHFRKGNIILQFLSSIFRHPSNESRSFQSSFNYDSQNSVPTNFYTLVFLWLCVIFFPCEAVNIFRLSISVAMTS